VKRHKHIWVDIGRTCKNGYVSIAILWRRLCGAIQYKNLGGSYRTWICRPKLNKGKKK